MKKIISSIAILLLSITFAFADVASKNPILQDEGTTVSGSGRILNFTGAGVVVTFAGGKYVITIGGGGSVSDAAYGISWSTVTDVAPSKKALYDKIETLGVGSGDVSSVGDCADGACLDGTSDGGTYIKFYDAQGVGTLNIADLSGAHSWTLPNHDATIDNLTTSTTTNLTGFLKGDGSTISTGDIALTTNTSGNYVASVATTSPLSGGAAGSEGATLTIAISKADTSTNGYLWSTDWNTFNNKQATVTEGSLADSVIVSADIKDGTVAYADIQNISATSRVLGRITAGAGVTEELTGANIKTIIGDVALTTDTSGNYVKDVADGTGIDGTASAEGATYTPSLDLTEISGVTISAGGSASFAWTFDLSGTDDVITFGSALITLNQGLTLITGKNFTIGTTQWNTGDSIDGEVIAADTIDDDSIDFADVTGADLTLTDCGAITTSGSNDITAGGDLIATGSDLTLGTAGVKLTGDGDGAVTILSLGDGNKENLVLNFDDTANEVDITSGTGVLDIDFNTIDLNTDTLDLTGTGTINGLDAVDATGEDTIEALIFDADAQDISGTWEVQDDVDFVFGNDANWKIQYDEGVDDQLIFITAGTGATATTDPLFEILVGATPTANQEVFGVSKGTQASNTALFTIDEDGDTLNTGNLTVTGGSITLGTSIIFSGGDTSSLNLIDAIDATTETTLEAALDIAGDVSSTGMGNTVIAEDAVHLGMIDWGTGANQVPLSKSFVVNGTIDTNSDYGCIWKTPIAITVTSVNMTAMGGAAAWSITGHLDECDSAGANCSGVDGATDITCTQGTNASDDASLSNGSIDANDWVGFHTTSTTWTTGGKVGITFNYTQ